jgi:cholesterol transport system auxiliary component
MMRAPMLRWAAIVALALSLAACGSQPVPDVAYYVLPPARDVVARDTPAFATPVLVDVFLADGLHAEQAILYSTKPGSSIKAYHYQLWNDPPTRLVQRRLIKRLRDAAVSPLVTDRIPGGLSLLHINGYINRFERINTGTTWAAVVDIELRVDSGDDQLPLLLKTYAAQVDADSDSMQGTVRAFTHALDQVLAEFTEDLATLQP